MQDRPTAAELLDAVREFVETEVLPAQADPRMRFRTLVALNALRILGRELAGGDAAARRQFAALAALLGRDPAPPDAPGALREALAVMQRELSARIRAGDPPPGTLDYLRAAVADKLGIASPGYLERYR